MQLPRPRNPHTAREEARLPRLTAEGPQGVWELGVGPPAGPAHQEKQGTGQQGASNAQLENEARLTPGLAGVPRHRRHL